MPAPQIILDLVERFNSNFTAYKSGQYNETPGDEAGAGLTIGLSNQATES